MSNQIVPLSSLSVNGKGTYGIAASAVPYAKDKYTYLRITDINDDGTLNIDDLKSVDDPDAFNYVLQPNDIVFARTGASTGRNYFYDGSDGTFVYAGFLIKFSIDPNKVNPLYVKYFCQSQKYRDWIYSFNTGSTRGNINERTLAQMPIELPSRRQQDLLVENLSKIDAKIKLNNQINRNLEEQAQALFKNWFVDFEPFGGKMPPDWKESALKDIVDINPSETLKKGKIAKKIGMDLLEPYKRDASVFVEEPYNGGSKFRNGDTLMARITPCLENGKISMVNILDDGEVGFGSTEYIVFRAKEGKTAPFYVYLLVTSDFVKDPAIKSMVGSSGRQRVQTDVVANLKLVTPSVEWMKKFSEIVEPMSSKITENTIEIQRLISIRDSLLPKLMSGEIDTDKMAV